MKIAIIRKKLTFLGGAESFSKNYISYLADLGHEVHVYAIKWSTSPHSNIYFHKVPAITFPSFLRDLTFAISSFFIIKKQRKYYDVIQSHDKTFYQDIYRAGDGCHIEWLKQRLKRKNLAGRFPIIINPYHWMILIMEKMIFSGHKFKKIIAGSNFVKRNVIENYNVNEGDIKVIYNGVDLVKFHPENRIRYRREIRNQYSIDENDFVVLFVGSGFERKGLKYLIHAVERVPQHVTVLVVGKGSPNKYYPLVKNQRIIFCGIKKNTHKYYAASDLFVFPPIYEPFGNVHLEAMASGLPVITTKLSGASEIIRDGEQGFVIEKPEDVDKIAEKVLLLMDKDLNQKMSAQARKLAEKFSFEKYIKETVELYTGLGPDKFQ
jgi:UDP-glucose:(heptosyl)LPS alpha-1,3-glucosyltransferase